MPQDHPYQTNGGQMKIFRQRAGSDADMHPDDELLLAAMADRGELNTLSFRWVHHLYFPDQACAQEARRQISAASWTIDWISAQPAPFPGWVLRASRDTVVTRTEARAARRFFEALAADTLGSYAGWDVRKVPRHALTGAH